MTGAIYQHMVKLPVLDSGVAEKLALGIERLNEALTRLSDADADPKRLDEKQSKLGEYVR